jgi:hypothetical protein
LALGANLECLVFLTVTPNRTEISPIDLSWLSQEAWEIEFSSSTWLTYAGVDRAAVDDGVGERPLLLVLFLHVFFPLFVVDQGHLVDLEELLSFAGPFLVGRVRGQHQGQVSQF